MSTKSNQTFALSDFKLIMSENIFKMSNFTLFLEDSKLNKTDKGIKQ